MNLKKNLGKRRFTAVIDITPLVDVVFILLIFLLVSTTFKNQENAFSIVLPVGDQKSRVTKVKRPTVFVTRAGDYIFYVAGEDPNQAVSGERLEDMQQLGESIETMVQRLGEDTSVSIKGDADTSYQSIMDVVNQCYKHGVHRVYFPYKQKEK
jgi:biopolymer transport protein ExbD